MPQCPWRNFCHQAQETIRQVTIITSDMFGHEVMQKNLRHIWTKFVDRYQVFSCSQTWADFLFWSWSCQVKKFLLQNFPSGPGCYYRRQDRRGERLCRDYFYSHDHESSFISPFFNPNLCHSANLTNLFYTSTYWVPGNESSSKIPIEHFCLSHCSLSTLSFFSNAYKLKQIYKSCEPEVLITTIYLILCPGLFNECWLSL